MNHSVIRQGTSTRLASLKGSRHEGLATRVHAMSAGRPTSVASLAMVQTTSDSMESTGGLLIAAGACLEAQACGVVVGACTRRWGGHGGAPAARRLGRGGGGGGGGGRPPGRAGRGGAGAVRGEAG